MTVTDRDYLPLPGDEDKQIAAFISAVMSLSASGEDWESSYAASKLRIIATTDFNQGRRSMANAALATIMYLTEKNEG